MGKTAEFRVTITMGKIRKGVHSGVLLVLNEQWHPLKRDYWHLLNIGLIYQLKDASHSSINIYAVQQDTQSVLTSEFILHLC